MFQERLLNGVEMSVPFEAFDSEDVFFPNILRPKEAGTDRMAVDQHGASAAIAVTAAVLGAGFAKVSSKDPKKPAVPLRLYVNELTVEPE